MGDGLRRWDRAEPILVVLVALHTLAVGLALVLATRWTLAFGGFPEGSPVFFARQGGAFHLVVGVGYLIEFARHRTVTLILVAKVLAVAFLGASILFAGERAWSVVVSAAGDGAMALVVALVHARARAERARGGALAS